MSWTIELVLGSYSWTINSDDAAAYGPTAGVTFGWRRDPVELAHPDHDFATIGVVVAQASDLGDLADDDPVALRLWFPPDSEASDPAVCKWSHYGRVSDFTGQPHDLGMVFTVNSVGYTVDAAEAQVLGDVTLVGYETGGGDIMPDSLVWAADALERAGLVLALPPATPGAIMVADREPGSTSAWTFLLEMLALSPIQVQPVGGEVPFHWLEHSAYPLLASGVELLGLPVVHAYATDAGRGRGDGVDFALDVLPKRQFTYTDDAPPPGHLELIERPGPDPGFVWSIVMDLGLDYWSVDAADIETDSARWRRAKDDRATDLTVTGWYPTGVLGPSAEYSVRIRRNNAPLTISARLETTVNDAERLVQALFPDSGEFIAWGAESYRYRLSGNPDGVPQLLPNRHDHDDGLSDSRAMLYTRPIVVSGMDPRHNPAPNPWVAGQVVAAEVTVDGDDVFLDFALNRNVPRPVPWDAVHNDPASGVGYFAPSDWGLVDPLGPTPTPADLDPANSVYDYRLLRKP